MKSNPETTMDNAIQNSEIKQILADKLVVNSGTNWDDLLIEAFKIGASWGLGKAREIYNPKEPPKIVHGDTCQKRLHELSGGYCHGDFDDRPYDIDGLTYCGRCHFFLGVAPAKDDAL